MPIIRWLPVIVLLLFAAFCFWGEYEDYMASKRRKKKGAKVIAANRRDDGPLYDRDDDWGYEGGWYGYGNQGRWRWPTQEDVLDDMKSAIEKSKTTQSTTKG